MKFAGRKLKDLLSNSTLSVKAALLYGPDQGLVREYSKNLSLKCTPSLNNPFSVSEFTGPQLKHDPSILVDAVYSMSLAGDDCVIIIRDAQDNITPTLNHIFSLPTYAWPIIIEANTLSSKSTLRKIFEQSTDLASIACYPEEGHILECFIEDFFAQEGLSIDRGANQLLCASLAGDRQIVRRELEKLSLYCLAKQNDINKVSETDVMVCVRDSSEMSLDNLVYSVGDGNQAQIDKTLAKAFVEGVSPIVVIRSVQRHFQRLHFIHSQKAQGKSFDQSLGKLHPPIFFKRKINFQHQVLNWTPEKLNEVLILTTKSEIDCKTTSLPAVSLCNRTLMRIAQVARRS